MIHQIWFDLGKGNEPLEPNGIESMQYFCKINGWEHKIWSQQEANDIIDDMPIRIKQIWMNLPHPITRIDFFRYILMYKFGGMYFDIDFNYLKDLNNFFIQDTIFLCEEWPFSFKNGSLHNGVLICKSPNHPFWLNVLTDIEIRLNSLKREDFDDIQKSVFKLTGTAMLRDVAYSYLNQRNSLLGHSIIVMPYGFFCPLVCEDGTYIDSYDDLKNKMTQTWRLPSTEIIKMQARTFTSGFLGASVKVWQHNFT